MSAQVPEPTEVERMIAGMSIPGRAPRLPQVAETAAFRASDRADGITGTIVHLPAGMLVG